MTSMVVLTSKSVLTGLALLACAACGTVNRSAAPESSSMVDSSSMVESSSMIDTSAPASPPSTSTSSSQSGPPSPDASVRVQASTRVPPEPTIEGVTAGEGSLAVRVSGPSGAGPITQYVVTAEPEAGGAQVTTQWPCRPWEMPCTINGLEVGGRYIVRAAAMNAYGAGAPAEGGVWVAGTPKPTPKPAPPDYPELPTTILCAPGQGGSFGLRDVYVTISNWLDDDLYVREGGEQLSRRTKGRITSSTTGHRCTSSGNTSLNAPTYLYLDLGFGEVPVLRAGPSGPTDYQYIDLWNPWVGLPSISVGIKDPARGMNQLYLKGNAGEGAALAWAGKYFYVTRQPDDSCAPDRICWTVVMSRLPDGVQDGMTWSWGGGGQTKGPDPVPLN